MFDGFTCRILRGDSVVFESDKRGVAPLVEAIDGGLDLKGCVAYDKIVGRAAALLYALMGVAEVHAGTLSVGGKAVLEVHGIACDCRALAERIVNRSGDGICPMETATEGIDDPTDALRAIKRRMLELSSSR